MNFLAHIYLSFNDRDLQVGNFIADSVRSSDLPQYSEVVQKGIKLHWEIDRYTDSHPIVKESKALLYDRYGKYSAVLVDIFYDHYLAKNWNEYDDSDLYFFVDDFYQLLESRKPSLPQRVQHMIPYMKRYNWLYNYQYLDGMERVLGGMSRRATFDSKMEKGVEDLQLHYDAFGEHFRAFFPELETRAKEFLQSA